MVLMVIIMMVLAVLINGIDGDHCDGIGCYYGIYVDHYDGIGCDDGMDGDHNDGIDCIESIDCDHNNSNGCDDVTDNDHMMVFGAMIMLIIIMTLLMQTYCRFLYMAHSNIKDNITYLPQA